MTFGAPQWFWGLLAIPTLILLFIRGQQKGIERLREFVSPRLLPQLIGTVDRRRRAVQFGLQLFGVACVITALAQPRVGYTYQDVKRKGLDLLIAVDTSRSMLSNDIQPSRLGRVKLACQDLIADLTGDRVGLIAFAGRAFIQAPLTIDYDAVVQAVNDLDTKTIPEGGTNISEAITLATRTFGKSAAGNRALIIFTDGEELSGDSLTAAKSAADNGVRIFTVGVGTPQGSLIPVPSEDSGTSFVKDPNGQVVKSKLDEKRLRDVAQATGGIYLHLENGPRTMRQLTTDGLGTLKAAEMDVRLARQPIERYHWPLGLGLLALASSVLVGERRRERTRGRLTYISRMAAPAGAAIALITSRAAMGAVPGLQLYDNGKFPDAYQSFEQDLQNHPKSAARDRMQFDAGTAAYKMREYNKALESFSQSLLSPDRNLQERSHYNLGRTLEDRADLGKSDDETLKDLEDAESHYEAALKLDPSDEAAKNNLEEVQKKIERLKEHRPTPTPSPQSQQKKDNKQQNSGENDQQSQSSDKNQQNQQQQQSESQSQNNSAQNSQQQKQQQQKSQNQQKNDQQQSQSLAKNEPPKNPQPKPNESPSPSGGQSGKQDQPAPNEQPPDQPPTPSDGQEQSPSPSPGEGSQGNPEPTATPSGTPRKPNGELKAASPDDQSQNPPQNTQQLAEGENANPGQMTPQQAEALLRSMKDEEARVQLDERRQRRSVYKDW